MKLEDFDYNLPDELIATEPADPRDSARLLVLHKDSGEIEHKIFRDVIEYFEAGDVLVLNNSKVIPARLVVERLDEKGVATGGVGEIFLLARQHDLCGADGDVWQCLIKGRVKPGGQMRLDNLLATVKEDGNDATWLVKFNLAGAEFMTAVEKLGQVPLPPYIEKRRQELGSNKIQESDEREYQTVFAEENKAGSVAAPTAGLHFTPELLEKLKNKGVEIVCLTLHVGLGTFLPVKVEKVEEHKMHAEWAEVPAETIATVKKAKEFGRRIITVGTTSTRALEACWQAGAPDNGWQAWVDIFIYPGFRWQAATALITNFHLPKSTLMMLVSALASKENIDQAYAEAIKEGYRFYSYGDAMLII